MNTREWFLVGAVGALVVLVLFLGAGVLLLAGRPVIVQITESAATPMPTTDALSQLGDQATPSLTSAVTAVPTPPTTYDNVFLYCAAVGTVDAPDNRYTGPAIPQTVTYGLSLGAGPWPGIAWRCMDGKVLACAAGANFICARNFWDTSTVPNSAMVTFCRQSPNADFIDRAGTGHSTVYDWRCVQGAPVIVGQAVSLDSRGFGPGWREIRP